MDGAQNSSDNEPAGQLKPGETISPRTQPQAAPEPAAAAPIEPATSIPEPTQPTAAQPVPAAPQTTPPPEVLAPSAPVAVTPPASTQPKPAPEAFDPEPQPVTTWQGDPAESISWTASEFITHSKTAGWHTMIIVAAIVIAAVVWFVTKDIVSPAVIIIAGVVLSFYGGRRPKELQYQLDNHGISIGTHHFGFGDFRAFSLMEEGGAFDSISLIPTKRFLPMTTLYYDPADEDHILSIIGTHLPHQERKIDAVDALMRRIRF